MPSIFPGASEGGTPEVPGPVLRRENSVDDLPPICSGLSSSGVFFPVQLGGQPSSGAGHEGCGVSRRFLPGTPESSCPQGSGGASSLSFTGAGLASELVKVTADEDGNEHMPSSDLHKIHVQ
ncbi:hypothetical protein M8J77_007491 [Diaphorina citri]|nr:hypothetical protein M8J77_007491 [Diaphorina citri]